MILLLNCSARKVISMSTLDVYALCCSHLRAGNLGAFWPNNSLHTNGCLFLRRASILSISFWPAVLVAILRTVPCIRPDLRRIVCGSRGIAHAPSLRRTSQRAAYTFPKKFDSLDFLLFHLSSRKFTFCSNRYSLFMHS